MLIIDPGHEPVGAVVDRAGREEAALIAIGCKSIQARLCHRGTLDAVIDRVYRCLLVLLLLQALPARGQSLGGAVFFSGTVTTNAAGQAWAYIVWQATDAALLQGQPVAVYHKTGGAGSTNLYTLLGVADYQVEPRTIAFLNNRAVQLGDDLAQVADHVDQLFSGLVPSPSLPLEEKMAGVMEGSVGMDEYYDNLTLLGRRHPAIALAIGQAWAERIPAGVSTFEMRQYDMAAQKPGVVLGRVSVTAGSPVVLPAPQSVQGLPETSAMGNLNVRLRWTAPAELRRLSLLQFGYNVYRMSQGYAVSNGFGTNPPTIGTLRGLLVSQSNQVKQLNRLPVLIDEEEVPTNEFFFVDDNNQFAEGGQPLADGAAYYYFVTARDLLGRDGSVSTGKLVSVCDRMPPGAPQRVRVQGVHVFTNGVTTNHLLVTWRQNDNSGSHTTANYYVYRWTSASNANFRSMTNHTAGLLAGPIAHIPGSNFNHYLDTRVPASNGVSYQYTVRAVDVGACGPNYSGHSGPAFGNLQDWQGPEAPTGAVMNVRCLWPLIITNQHTDIARVASNIPFRIRCGRDVTPPGIAWAEFWIADGSWSGTNGLSSARYLGRYFFGATGLVVSVDASLSNEEYPSGTVYCRAGTTGRRMTSYAVASDKDDSSKTVVFNFHAYMEPVEGPAGEPCEEVDIPPEDDDPGGDMSWTNRWPTFDFPTAPDVYEYRVYRSINGSEMSLVLQATNMPNTDVTNLHDRVGGALHCADVCYYLQVFDQHGNGSRIFPLGCVYAGIIAPGAPQNVSLVTTGSVATPFLTAQWDLDPPGVERFEVWVGVSSGAPPTSLTAALSTNISPPNTVVKVLDNGVEKEAYFATYLTGRLGTSFATDSQRVFSVTFKVDHGRRYYVFVRARSECATGPDSDVRSAIWTMPATGPEVPWPARPLPEVLGDFHPDVVAFYIASTANASRATSVAAVRIGEIPTEWQSKYPKDFLLPGSNTPAYYVYDDQNGGGELLPFALYRYQVATAKHPHAPGDVVQVSPLMEDIAYGKVGNQIYIRDPFIDVVEKSVTEGKAYLYLMDTQPVVRGATYRYLLVQFGKGGDPTQEGEPVRVIPTNELEIP